jgi:predicted dehydrogenase
MKPIRFGVIGAGLMGKEFASAIGRWHHLLEQSVRPEITAVCDVNEAARAWFERSLRTVALSTGDANAIFASKDVDAVYIAVPHDLHADLYVRAIESGKHLLGEKPFGIDRAACDRIMAAIGAHPKIFVRCSSEFPFYPGAQRVIGMIRDRVFGRILEVEAGFLHSSDLDPAKPINWKRRVKTCGEYGVLGDLGLHVCHIPFRFGWMPKSVHAVLSKVVHERPDVGGGMAPCETWDNARLTCRVEQDGYQFPMVLRTERIAPGETNTWFIRVRGTKSCAEFSTKHPKTLRTIRYETGRPQTWEETDLGYESATKAITGHIFEFGFPDAILQMWAAYCSELAGHSVPFGCVTPEEALRSHRLFTAALSSHRTRSEVIV